MGPDEIEKMLYEHAIKTKIRAPLAERLSNLGYNRVVTSGLVAGAALICTMLMPKTTPAENNATSYGMTHPTVTDTNTDSTKRPVLRTETSFPQSTDPVSASLAMSPVGG